MFLPLSSPPNTSSHTNQHPESFFHCNRAISLISPTKRALSPIQPTSFDDNISCNSTPTAILPFLYLGSAKDARNTTFLETENINYVINCSCEHRKTIPPLLSRQKGSPTNVFTPAAAVPAIDESSSSEEAFDDEGNSENRAVYTDTTSHAPELQSLDRSLGRSSIDDVTVNKSCIETLNIPALDSPQQDLKQYFTQAINFIETCRRANSSVLVHCGAGISRSATIVVAYLMWYLKLPFMASYKFVQKLRPQISPNLNFVGQLVAFGNDLPNMVCNDLKNAESQQQQQTRKRCWSEKTETDNSCLVPQRKKQGPTKSVYSADIISF